LPDNAAFSIMIGLLGSDTFFARQSFDATGAASSLATLCEISPREFRPKKMRLRRSVVSAGGVRLQVNLEIGLTAGHSVRAGDLTGIIQKSCGTFFEHALSTSHFKTVVGGLRDGEGRLVGDVVATFRPAPAFCDDAAFH